MIEGDEINEELIEGKRHAKDLVRHLLNMGAASCTIPISVDGVEYLVDVKRASPGHFDYLDHLDCSDPLEPFDDMGCHKR